MKTQEVDLAVIGAGPAGMAAALSAKKSGLENIMLLERAEYPGGLLHQCIHNGFGLHYFEEDLTGPEYAERFIRELASTNIELYLNTMVCHFHPDRTITAINPKWGEFKIVPKSVVLAMGCREKTRFSVSIPGSRPAGIFTAGLAQKLVNVDGYLPGKETVILGSGDIGMIMARRLTLEGTEVKAVVEIMPRVGGLIRNRVQCLNDFNIPLLLEHTITDVYGNYRVEGVKVARLDQEGNPIADTERDIRCDCLLLSVGLIPENELSREAGILLDPQIGGPVVDEFLQTSMEGVFAAGNVVQVWDLVDNVTCDGERTGVSAARYVAGDLRKQDGEIRVIPGDNVKTATPHKIVGSETVEFALRVYEPVEKAEVRVGNYRKKFKVVSPTEVVKISLEQKDLDLFRERGEITVSCSRRQGREKEKEDAC